MFNNIGKKLKVVANIICWLGIILSLVFGISFGLSLGELNEETGITVAFAIIVVGVLVSWLSAFLLYAFGQLVDNSDILVQEIRKINGNTDVETLTSNISAEIKTQISDTPEKPHDFRCGICGCIVEGDTCPVCNAKYI